MHTLEFYNTFFPFTAGIHMETGRWFQLLNFFHFAGPITLLII